MQANSAPLWLGKSLLRPSPRQQLGANRHPRLLPFRNHRKVVAKQKMIDDEIERLESTRIDSLTLAQMLRRPGTCYSDLPNTNENLAPRFEPSKSALLVVIGRTT